VIQPRPQQALSEFERTQFDAMVDANFLPESAAQVKRMARDAAEATFWIGVLRRFRAKQRWPRVEPAQSLVITSSLAWV